jgi:hypothetical protein
MFDPQIQNLRTQQNDFFEGVEMRIQTNSRSTSSRFDLTDEKFLRLSSAQKSFSEDMLSVLDELSKIKEKHSDALKTINEVSIKQQQLRKSDVESVSSVSQNLFHAGEAEHIREQIQSLQYALDSINSSQRSVQTGFDDSLFDLSNSVEKLKLLEMDTKNKLGRL